MLKPTYIIYMALLDKFLQITTNFFTRNGKTILHRFPTPHNIVLLYLYFHCLRHYQVVIGILTAKRLLYLILFLLYINKALCHKSRYINFALTGIEHLQEWKRNGNKLILWTCRAGEALSKAVEWYREQNLEFDAVNDNLPEIIEFYGHNSRKISSDYYIDDRMLLPENAKA